MRLVKVKMKMIVMVRLSLGVCFDLTFDLGFFHRESVPNIPNTPNAQE